MLKHKKFISDIIREKDKQIEELDNILKSIICKFNDNQIEVSSEDIRRAKQGNLYKEVSYTKNASIYKVIFSENFVLKDE